MTVPGHEPAILTKARTKTGELRAILLEGRYDTLLEHLSQKRKGEAEEYRIAFPDRGARPFSIGGKDLVEAVTEWKLIGRYRNTAAMAQERSE